MAMLFGLTESHERLRAVYTFGQPMVVSGPLEASTEALGRKLFRYS